MRSWWIFFIGVALILSGVGIYLHKNSHDIDTQLSLRDSRLLIGLLGLATLSLLAFIAFVFGR